jgi:sialate O-acetylesterase
MSEVYGLMERSETLPPMYDSYEVRRGKMLIKLKNCKGLSGKDENYLDGFEIAGADGVYFPAKATVKIPYIELECDDVKLPVSARFQWTNYAQVGLFGLNDLPLPPFRTDKTIN